jgi:hypothetical protein
MCYSLGMPRVARTTIPGRQRTAREGDCVGCSRESAGVPPAPMWRRLRPLPVGRPQTAGKDRQNRLLSLIIPPFVPEEPHLPDEPLVGVL